MGALGFVIDVDTSGADGPTLRIDGEAVPLLEFGYEQGPAVARWSFVVPVGPGEGDGVVEGVGDVDPDALQEAAMERIDRFEGQTSPYARAVLSVLRDAR